jgi:hypothetical protein
MLLTVSAFVVMSMKARNKLGTRAGHAALKFLKGVLRQPLGQFLLAGSLICVVFALVARPEPAQTTIQVGAAELKWLYEVWQGQFGRAPTYDELRAAVKVYEDEEMRYREALALGLDRDDTIVRRRMAQKYDFLMGAQGTEAHPTETQLRTLFDAQADRYRAPALLQFCQVYFGLGPQGLLAARAAVAGLPPAVAKNRDAVKSANRELPYPRCFEGVSQEDVRRQFGTAFADVLSRLPLGSWQGPVESGYGFHAVLLLSRQPGRPLSFTEAVRAVDADWRAEATRQARAGLERDLRKRYRMVVDEAALRALTDRRP